MAFKRRTMRRPMRKRTTRKRKRTTSRRRPVRRRYTKRRVGARGRGKVDKPHYTRGFGHTVKVFVDRFRKPPRNLKEALDDNDTIHKHYKLDQATDFYMPWTSAAVAGGLTFATTGDVNQSLVNAFYAHQAGQVVGDVASEFLKNLPEIAGLLDQVPFNPAIKHKLLRGQDKQQWNSQKALSGAITYQQQKQSHPQTPKFIDDLWKRFPPLPPGEEKRVVAPPKPTMTKEQHELLAKKIKYMNILLRAGGHHEQEVPKWEGPGDYTGCGDYGNWNAKNIQQKDLFAHILSHMSDKAAHSIDTATTPMAKVRNTLDTGGHQTTRPQGPATVSNLPKAAPLNTGGHVLGQDRGSNGGGTSLDTRTNWEILPNGEQIPYFIPTTRVEPSVAAPTRDLPLEPPPQQAIPAYAHLNPEQFSAYIRHEIATGQITIATAHEMITNYNHIRDNTVQNNPNDYDFWGNRKNANQESGFTDANGNYYPPSHWDDGEL